MLDYPTLISLGIVRMNINVYCLGMSRKQERINEIISKSIMDIPVPEGDAYDPNEALQDASKLLRSVFDARLKHYIDSKEENVKFILDLSDFLTGLYPRKKTRKPRKQLTGEQLDAAKANGKNVMSELWAIPNGKMYARLSDERKQAHAKKKGLNWKTGKALAKK